MKPLEILLEALRARGMRITPQRRLILELLCGDSSHPTVDDIYTRAVAAMPNISRTTVYNTLRELVRLGELAPVEGLSDASARYDTRTDDHVFCVSCGKLVDIDQVPDRRALTDVQTAGFQVFRHQVTYYGFCPDCRRRRAGAAT